MLVLQRVPHVDVVVVRAAQQNSAAEGQTARSETAAGRRRLEERDLLVAADVEQSSGFVLGTGSESVTAGVELQPIGRKSALSCA